MKPNKEVIAILSRALADTFTLYLNTHKCHWNVEGPNFYSLHLMLEKQYGMLYEDADTLAERIRALGAYAPGSFEEFQKLATVKSYTGPQMSAEKMIAFLLKGYEDLLKTLYEAMKIAHAHGDESTFDVVIGQIDIREKTSWMLRSSLK